VTEVINNILIGHIKLACNDAKLPAIALQTGGWLVKFGPLQQDPGENGINILISTNDPDSSDLSAWCNETITSWPLQGNIGTLPYGFNEIGGSFGYIRRFTVKTRIFLTNTAYSEEDRDIVANQVLGSLENALLTSRRYFGKRDSYGERPIGGFYPLAKSAMTGGGESGIYDAKIWLEFKTERDV